MKPQLKLLVATLSTVVFAGMSGLAMANGAVQNLSGTISVQKPDGTIRVLAKNSEVTKGDTIETQKDSYAQVKFSDGATMTMKPGTRVKIDSYAFNQAEPMKDNSTLNLLRGGLRMVTGLIGKRGDQDALKLGTATATIGIRGTTFNVDDCVTTSCERRSATRVGSIEGGIEVASLGDTELGLTPVPSVPSDATGFARWADLERVAAGIARDPFALVAQASTKCPTGNPNDCLEPAVFVGVSDGEVILRNSAGETRLRAGQFGAAANFTIKPDQLPGDPGMNIFTLPQNFFQSIGPGGVTNGRNATCIVN